MGFGGYGGRDSWVWIIIIIIILLFCFCGDDKDTCAF